MTSPAPRDAMIDRRVPQIDGLRALGMLMVYLFHVREFSGCPAWNIAILGHRGNLLGFLGNFGSGVDLFMVISGFCLFWPLCKSADSAAAWDWRHYLRRRVRRIVPPYYAAIGYAIVVPMVLVAIFHQLGLAANWQPVPSTWQLLTHFLFIHSLFLSTWNGITGAFWSLGLEGQFYAVFPLVVLAYRRAGLKAICWMILFSVIFQVAIAAGVPSPALRYLLSISCLGRWMEFGCGMLTAMAIGNYWRVGRYNSAAVGTAQIAVALGLYIVAIDGAGSAAFSALPITVMLLSISFSLLILALCTSRTPLVRLFSNPVSNWLGGISYSLYLLHQPTAWYLSEFFKKQLHITGAGDFLLLSTAGFAIVVAIAYPFHVIFERPGLRMNGTPKAKPTTAPENPELSTNRVISFALAENPHAQLQRLDCR